METNPGFFDPRMGNIEGREDLFETSLLRIKKPEVENSFEKILVASRDPGSANALFPVMNILIDKVAEIDVITDGRAKEVFSSKFDVEDITPKEPVLEMTNLIDNPNLILTDASSEKGIEGYTASTFSEVPTVLVEDYYASSLEYLKACQERYGHFPDKICVMDEEAKKIIAERLPELVGRIEVTGQPAFDVIAKEDKDQIQKKVKEQLGLSPSDQLVAFMSTDEVSSSQVEEIARYIAQSSKKFYLAFRKHPRDNTNYEQYYQAIKSSGLQFVEAENFTTDEIGAAADLVVTTWSTEGIRGIYRGKPTIHFYDKKVLGMSPPLVPPVKLGASIGIENADQFASSIDGLLDRDSDLYKSVLTNMNKYYPSDGKNSERVANVVMNELDLEKK